MCSCPHRKNWILAVVKEIFQQPDSYVVVTTDGREFRRNRRAINICRGQQNIHTATSPSVKQVLPSAVVGRHTRSSFVFPSFTLPISVPVTVSVHPPLLISVPVSATSSVAGPVPIVQPAVRVVAAVVGQNNQTALVVVARKFRKPREWPPSSRSSVRLAAKSSRRSSSQSLASSTASHFSSALDPTNLAATPPVAVSESLPVPDQDVRDSLVPVAKT
jgi:hypothetical protein